MLLGFGAGRTLWLGLIPLAPHGTGGLVLIIVSETLLLFCAGAFNPTFTTYRMNATGDDHMARVNAAWSISSKSAQPAFITAGGGFPVRRGERDVEAIREGGGAAQERGVD